MRPRSRGQLSAWAAFGAGITVSVAANVAHTWYPAPSVLRAWRATHGLTAAWHPSPVAQIAAAWWPVALLLCIEIVTRVRWHDGARWAVARYGGTGLVAVVAAVVSYRHMAGLLAAVGEDGLTAAIGPLAVDGLMVVASVALLSIATEHRQAVTSPAGMARAGDIPPESVTGPGPAAAAVPAPAVADSAGITPAVPDPPGLAVPAHAAAAAAGEGGRRLSKKERAARLLADAPPMPEDRLAAWLAGQLGVSQRYGRQLRGELAAAADGRSAGHA